MSRLFTKQLCVGPKYFTAKSCREDCNILAHIRYTRLQILLFEGAHQNCYNKRTAPNLSKLKSVFLYFFRFSVFLPPFQPCAFILPLFFLYSKFVAACYNAQSSENVSVCLWHDSPQWATVSSSSRFLDHTQGSTSRYNSSGRLIGSSQRPLPDDTQHSQQTDIHAPGEIRPHDLSRRAATDIRLRPRGQWDGL